MAILPRFVRRSLRAKIIAWSFFPTAAVLVVVALVLLYAYQQVTEDLVMTRDWELTRLTAQQLGDELETYADRLSTAARPAGDVDSTVLEEEILGGRGGLLSVFDAGIVVLDPHGAILDVRPESVYTSLSRWLSEQVLRQAAQGAEPAFTNALPVAPDDAAVVAVTVPVLVGGEPAGAVMGLFRVGSVGASPFYGDIERGVRRRFNLPEGVLYTGRSSATTEARPQGLERLFASPRDILTRLGGEGNTYIVDGSGRVLYHSDAAWIGRDMSSSLPVRRLMEQHSGALHTRDARGRRILATYAAIPGTPWGLVTEESWAALLEPGRRYQRFLWALLLLGVLAPAAVVTVGVTRIVRPIRYLAQAAAEVAAGDFDQRISAPTGDELDDLAQQFNRMAKELDASYANLERRVGDRTRELAALNAIATELGRSLDLQRVVEDALDRSIDVIGAFAGEVFRLADEGEPLERLGYRGLPVDVIAGRERLPLDAFPLARVEGAWRPGIADMRQVPERLWQQLAWHQGLRRMVTVPLIAQERLVGAMNLYLRADRGPSAEEVELLAAVGHQVGMAMENAHLHARARQLAVAEERGRLSRDLHDSVTQTLYGVTLYAQAASRLLKASDTARAAEHLEELERGARQALQEMRLLVFQLRPPVLEKEGLVAALQARLDAVEGRTGVQATLHAECPGDDLDPAIEEGLYWVAQEALNNVLRHASARGVCVALECDAARIVLEVRDAGAGFDPQAVAGRGGVGLPAMAERTAQMGGTLTIESAPGKGTCVRVEVPV